ncbi:MAG TPA: FeoA family protein, partial [Candidatus Bilamarchaeaceae archaeon]|nr:FeoA family protein [Candidatus Bilamarchaeaceae archaeon]
RLSLMRPGESGKIVLVSGGKAARDRLMEMGLTPGTKITVRHTSTRHGPMEICVRSSCLALGRGIAEKILVEVS